MTEPHINESSIAQRNSIVYDLETQKTFAEVGANRNADLGISYLGLYSYTQDKYFGFWEKDLSKLELILSTTKPTIIGFNSISFDNVVLQPYLKELVIQELPQIDILAEIYNRLGFRMKLESVAQATLGTGKSGSGLDAIRYYREGNFDALSKYCLDDVRITKELFEYGAEHGFILYTSGGDLQRMPVSWKEDETIADRLQKAFAGHYRLHMTYLHTYDDKPSERIETDIDILHIGDKTIEAYSHTENRQQKYAIHRILHAELLDATYAHQGTLL